MSGPGSRVLQQLARGKPAAQDDFSSYIFSVSSLIVTHQQDLEKCTEL